MFVYKHNIFSHDHMALLIKPILSVESSLIYLYTSSQCLFLLGSGEDRHSIQPYFEMKFIFYGSAGLLQFTADQWSSYSWPYIFIVKTAGNIINLSQPLTFLQHAIT